MQSQRGTSSHHGKYNTEPMGDTQPARKNRACGKTAKMELCQRTEENSTQASAMDTKNIGDIEDIPNTELKIHLLYRTGAAIFMKIHAAASYFSFKIVIIISHMESSLGAAKTDCTDIGFLK